MSSTPPSYRDLPGIPPLWEAASLKLRTPSRASGRWPRYSASLGGGLIEASSGRTWTPRANGIPPLWEAASLKQHRAFLSSAGAGRIPPLWEAASLKRARRARSRTWRWYSASLGGGLIEASRCGCCSSGKRGIPPLWEAASLKRPAVRVPGERPQVFRLFGRRPH